MASWSIFVRSASQSLQKIRGFRHKFILNNVINFNQTRNMSSEMIITASRWQWHKTKDLFHFYFFIMAIPLGIITFYTNVFIGPATLTEIPEDYYPEYWEYYRHPISRFLARYIFCNPQKDYEKSLSMLYYESQITEFRKLEEKIMKLNKELQIVEYGNMLLYRPPYVRENRELIKSRNS